MERLITKKEIRAVRKALGMTRQDFAEFIGVHESSVAKSEGTHEDSYKVTKKFDKKIKDKLQSIGVSIEEVLKIAKKEGWIK